MVDADINNMKIIAKLLMNDVEKGQRLVTDRNDAMWKCISTSQLNLIVDKFIELARLRASVVLSREQARHLLISAFFQTYTQICR